MKVCPTNRSRATALAVLNNLGLVAKLRSFINWRILVASCIGSIRSLAETNQIMKGERS